MTFHDIFSSKPETPIHKTPIIVDIHEKNSLVPAFLSKLKANYKIEHLEIADYLIGDIAIERKTFSDFVSSILNRRLLNQLAEIKKYPRHFLILEGEKDSNLKNPSRGMLLSIIINYKIPILFTSDEEDTANFLFLLAKKLEKPKQEFALRQSRSQMTNEQQKQFILEGFPGIGATTAKSLLSEFKILSRIFSATNEELSKIKSENKRKKFRELLDC